jgi:zinc/manganese transport system substrate-binding protein
MNTHRSLSRRRGLAPLVLLALAAVPSGAAAGDEPLRVVTTTPDLADLARRIGGSRVEAVSLTSGTEDFHAVRARPSLLVRLSRADVLIEMGLDLEHAWLPPLLQSARNDRIRPGAPGFINVSAGIVPLEVPDDKTRRAGPDNHPQGNPHFNLSPSRARTIADNILAGLASVDPAHREEFAENHRRFVADLETRIARWRERLEPLRGAALIEVHSSFAYFAEEFGLRIVAKLEPKPGVSPSPEHLARVIEIAKREKVGIIVARPANIDLAKKVAAECGATAAVIPLSSTTEGEFSGYLEYLERVVALFERSLRR